MPFYQCITLAGTLAQEQKEEIVRDITRIHCETTGCLPQFVQIRFDEVKPGDIFQNAKLSRAVRLHGRIRAGRDARHEAPLASESVANLTSSIRAPNSATG